ncbi:MAG TPA: sugar phosphate isomerase/epimerase family protein [Bryobacteraceae bacterium]|nr:sugar phosphate isomerase/epimerase family protein [Bryobacteraceae bacterium]
MTRREWLLSTLAAAPALARRNSLKIGVTDWNLKLAGKLEAVSLAQRLGFEGVQISLGRKPVDNKLALDNEEVIANYVAASKKEDIPLDGTCLDILHVNYLKNDKLGQKWVAESIPVTKKLGSKVILLPFFGKGALTNHQEMDYVGDVLKELAPEAEKAGVILGLEDTISAQDNVRIMERSGSKAVMVYYDVGNSTIAGFDPAKEIRWLGKKRICQFHLKDNPHYLGEGDINFPRILHAIADIGYQGFANLETDSPSHNIEADMHRNLTYMREIIQQNPQA